MFRLASLSAALLAVLMAGNVQSAENYRDSSALARDAKALAKQYGARVQLETYGQSAGGKPLYWLRIAAAGAVAPEQRPAVFVGANVAGFHHVGSEAAMALATQLASSDDPATQALLQRRTFYFAPLMNPDAHDAMFAKPRRLQSANAQILDIDIDGLAGEDGGDDLDGDGVIAQMHIRDARGHYIIDPDDARRLIEADPAKGQRGEYHLLSEGKDDDGDGEYNENPASGIVVDRNFPAGFVVGRPEYGAWPGLAPEVRAAMDQLLKHRNINLAIVYGPANQLLEAPKGFERITPPGAKPSAEANKPEDEDLKSLAALGETYRKALTDAGYDSKRFARQSAGGSLSTWLYFHYGVQTLELDVWGPDKTPAKKAAPAETPEATASGTGNDAATVKAPGTEDKNGKPENAQAAADKAAPGKNGADKPGAEKNPADKAAAEKLAAEKALLTFLEQQNPAAILPWTSVKLADGRSAETGGRDPFAEYLPPYPLLQPLLSLHGDQILDWAGDMAELELLSVESRQQADDVWLVRAVAGVKGRLPTHTSLAARMKNRLPVNMEMTHDSSVTPLTLNNRVVSERLDSKGKLSGEWLLKGARGKKVTISVWTPHNGRASKTLVLGEEN